MTRIRIMPADAGSWPAVEHALTGGGDGASCWCQWFRLTNQEWDATDRDQRRSLLRDEIEDAGIAPGLIVHVDDEAVGWCRVGPRVHQPRLARSRVANVGGATLRDDPRVWAVTCFVVRRAHRGQGIARRLAEGAVEFARREGASLLQAYAIDVAAKAQVTPNELYVGSASLFEAVGFTPVARPTPSRVVLEYRFDA